MRKKERNHASPQPLMKPCHPGSLLKEEVIPALGLPISQIAKELGTSRQSLHRILNGTQPVTVEMSLRLGKYLGNGPGIWLRMQQAYDLWVIEGLLHEEINRIPIQHPNKPLHI